MKKILLLFLFITLFGCNDENLAKKIEFRKGVIFTPNGDKPYTGEGILYYDDNNIESRGFSKDGIKDGEWIYFFYNGKLKRKGSYRNGKIDGHWIYYNHDETVEGEVEYIGGKEIKK